MGALAPTIFGHFSSVGKNCVCRRKILYNTQQSQYQNPKYALCLTYFIATVPGPCMEQ